MMMLIMGLISLWMEIVTTMFFQEKIVFHLCFGFTMAWLRFSTNSYSEEIYKIYLLLGLVLVPQAGACRDIARNKLD